MVVTTWTTLQTDKLHMIEPLNVDDPIPQVGVPFLDLMHLGAEKDKHPSAEIREAPRSEEPHKTHGSL